MKKVKGRLEQLAPGQVPEQFHCCACWRHPMTPEEFGTGLEFEDLVITLCKGCYQAYLAKDERLAVVLSEVLDAMQELRDRYAHMISPN